MSYTYRGIVTYCLGRVNSGTPFSDALKASQVNKSFRVFYYLYHAAEGMELNAGNLSIYGKNHFLVIFLATFPDYIFRPRQGVIFGGMNK